MSAFWEAQRQQASAEAWQAGADLAADWNARCDAKRADKAYQAAYAQALAAAKTSGVIGPDFQRHVLEDDAVTQIGIKAVLLQELAKLDPKHPLVVSKACRSMIGAVTRVKFNRANRPGDVEFADYAPDAEEAERILEAYK